MATHQIKLSPLTPLPSKDPLTRDQWRTLLAFADTVVPSVVPKAQLSNPKMELPLDQTDYAFAMNKVESYARGAVAKDPGLARRYMLQKASDIQAFKDSLYRLLSFYVPDDLKQQMTLGLNLLNYRITSVLLTGRPVVFADQTIKVREEIIQSWATAKIPIVRLLFKSLTLLVKQTWAKNSMLLHDMIGMPRIPVHGQPVKSWDYKFVQIPPGDKPEIFETDVIVVGSGIGGGIAAKNLAEAGYNVIVADKGYHWPADHLPMVENEGWVHLFHNGGFLFSEDSSSCVIAGQTWGGGGTVNWSASLQPQDFVRKEWADGGLPFFTSAEFQDCLDTVCGRMGVGTDQIKHNPQNATLLEGARKLGMTAKVVPQNTGGQLHYCGYCTMGCGSCEKLGPANSFLVDAAKRGAHFIEGFDVKKVIIETKKSGRKVAVGVEGTWTSRDTNGGVAGKQYQRKVIIKAKRVIVSGGTMHTPIILMRSGLKNRHIGKNLKLHPVQIVGAVQDEETRPWEGGILTAVVSSLENMDQKGHGVKLECTTMLPSTWLAFPVWRGGVDWKVLAPRHRNMVGYISMARDIGSGSVYPDPKDGRPRFSYNAIKKDRKHIMAGMQALAKINYVAGAREIFTSYAPLETFVRKDPKNGQKDTDGVNDKRFKEWLQKMEKYGLPDPDITTMSAHQMGTCRMGATPKKGAIDPYGKTWEVDGLYVADASTFPSASGVNPMITNMGISEWVSRNIVKDLRSGGRTKGKL